jgi:hypothetical protein
MFIGALGKRAVCNVFVRAIVSLLAGIGLMTVGAALGFAAALYKATGDEPVPLSQGHVTVQVDPPPGPGAPAPVPKPPSQTYEPPPASAGAGLKIPVSLRSAILDRLTVAQGQHPLP